MQSWERLNKVIEWSGLSTHAFAMRIGMKRSENLYRIKRSHENISNKLASMIAHTYPEINRFWLISGDGEMFHDVVNDPINSMHKIPYYSSEVNEILDDENNFKTKPTFFINIPTFKDIDLAITTSSDAMMPAVPVGSIMLMKKQSVDMIIYGQMYYLTIDDISLVRIIRKSEKNDDDVILEAINSEKYDKVVVNRAKLTKILLICGVVNKFI